MTSNGYARDLLRHRERACIARLAGTCAGQCGDNAATGKREPCGAVAVDL
jgi:hypothetical protein